MKRYYSIMAVLAVVMAGAAASFSQSTSRDNPLALYSSEISGNMNDLNRETFYSFTAGPGEVTITLDVNAKRDNQGLLNFDVLARDGSTSLACCYYAQGNGGGTGRDVATFKLTKRQTVILHTTNGPIGGGTFHFRVTGAATFDGSPAGGRDNAGNGGFGNGSGGETRGRGNSGGDPVDVPQTGILHIRMKNGTVRDIDLSQIRSITVRQ